ncbi:putative transcriptional regulator [Gammaproteobacteria bacterium]
MHRLWEGVKGVDAVRESRIIPPMRTVIETPTFQKQAEKIWSEDERMEFIVWISKNPMAGDVIPGAEGARKVRWSVAGKGKRGGVRVIYFNLTEQGTVVLVTLYQKTDQTNIQASDIKKAM